MDGWYKGEHTMILASFCGIVAMLYVMFDPIIFKREYQDCDFLCYYRAAKGDFEKLDGYPEGFAGWCYPTWIAHLWKPFTWVDEVTAATIWWIVLIACYAILLLNLSLVNYGWLLILASAKPFSFVIRSGNISVVLAFLCLTPIGSAVACIFKPFLLPIVGIHLFRSEIQAWIQAVAQ
jgi:hypothetical protein